MQISDIGRFLGDNIIKKRIDWSVINRNRHLKLHKEECIQYLQSKGIGISEEASQDVPIPDIVGPSSSIEIINDELQVETNGQTVFKLSKKPANINNILFYVNGIKYNREDYEYNTESNSIIWKRNDELPIKIGYYISVLYVAE